MFHYIDSTEHGWPGTASSSSSSFGSSTLRSWCFPESSFTASTSGSSISVRLVAGTLSNWGLRLDYDTISMAWGNLSHPLKNTVSTKLFIGFLYETKNVVSGNGNAIAPTAIVKIGAAGATTTVTTDALIINADGSFTFNGVTSATGLLAYQVPGYLEVVVDFVAGTVDVYLDDVLILSSTTTLTEASQINWMVTAQGVSSRRANTYDNIVIYDDQGEAPTTRLGPCKAVACPLSASVETNFTPQGGAANNLDAVQKSDFSTTTYNQSTSVNDVGDTFTLDTSGIALGSDVIGVNVCAMAKKTDAGARNLAMVNSDGINKISVVKAPDPVAFTGTGQAIFATAADGTAWDLTKLAAAEIGYEAKA